MLASEPFFRLLSSQQKSLVDLGLHACALVRREAGKADFLVLFEGGVWRGVTSEELAEPREDVLN